MKKTMKFASAASLLALAVAATTANAGVLLDSLYFEQYAGWDDTEANWTFDTSNGLTGLYFDGALVGPNDPANTYSNMSWEQYVAPQADGESDADYNARVAAAERSFIDIATFNSTDPGAGDGEWNEGDVFAISELIHTNNVLQSDLSGWPDPLWVADALANFYVSDNEGGTTFLADENSKTTISFWETRNVAGCAESPTPLGTTCDDIFRVTAATLAPLSFIYDDYVYTVDFGLAPGPSSSGDSTLVCTTEGCSDGSAAPSEVVANEIWVFTPETAPGTASLFVTAQWSARAVPEPSVLALFGGGMLGLGLVGRRRKQRNQS